MNNYLDRVNVALGKNKIKMRKLKNRNMTSHSEMDAINMMKSKKMKAAVAKYHKTRGGAVKAAPAGRVGQKGTLHSNASAGTRFRVKHSGKKA